MTNRGNCKQGEGCSDAKHLPFRGEPLRWLSTVLLPQECIRVELVVHQTSTPAGAALSFEVSDPHTKELLGKTVDPSFRYSQTIGLSRCVAMELSTVLEALLDPDPF